MHNSQPDTIYGDDQDLIAAGYFYTGLACGSTVGL